MKKKITKKKKETVLQVTKGLNPKIEPIILLHRGLDIGKITLSFGIELENVIKKYKDDFYLYWRIKPEQDSYIDFNTNKILYQIRARIIKSDVPLERYEKIIPVEPLGKYFDVEVHNRIR